MSAMRPQSRSPYGGPMPSDQDPTQPNTPGPAHPGSLPQPLAAPQQYAGAQPQSAQPIDPAAPSAGGAPTPANPAAPATPYDFFMNEGQPQKKPSLAGSLPQGPGGQILLFAAAGGLIIIILLVLMFALPKGDKKETLVKLNQTQVETLRLCTAGASQAKDTVVRQFAANCMLSQASDSRQLTTYLGKVGIKVDGKILALGRNAKADSQLSAGSSSSDYDDAYRTVMTAQLSAQIKDIRSALASPDVTKNEKEQLTAYGTATTLLTKQLNGGSDDPNNQDIKINTPSENTGDDETTEGSSQSEDGTNESTNQSSSSSTTNSNNSNNSNNSSNNQEE